ncbi:MAG: efflux RND transporter periplasmic adaptor subunit [Halofilum sp. (in: g-proteobacteria)]|nr:efflux RND transporter periplasmic adaptor subunit [Halofilum sp. (in: g-proteobacteria)]
MKKRMFLTLLGCLVVFGGVFGYLRFVGHMTEQALSNRPPPVETVSAIEAVTDTWQPQIRAVGSLGAVRGVDLATEIEGRVNAVAVEDGAAVEAGQVLVELDAAGLRAELRGARAEARLAELELERQRRLRQQNANSEADVDRAASQLEQARARVERVQANLEKKTIRAPFGGRIGIIGVDVGQFLVDGTEVVTLQTLDPINVDFTVPQRELARIENGQPVVVSVDAFAGESFAGAISAISPKVEQSTRNTAVRARLGNPEGRLRPGMFVQVAVQLPGQTDVVTLPQTAITYNPYGDSVFLVHETTNDAGETVRTVERKFVRTGATRGDQVQVLQGVEPGQTVVTSGQLKLRNGSRVTIDNSPEPANDPSPELGNH